MASDLRGAARRDSLPTSLFQRRGEHMLRPLRRRGLGDCPDVRGSVPPGQAGSQGPLPQLPYFAVAAFTGSANGLIPMASKISLG